MVAVEVEGTSCKYQEALKLVKWELYVYCIFFNVHPNSITYLSGYAFQLLSSGETFVLREVASRGNPTIIGTAECC